MAKEFSASGDRVFICGDAAHTHSSGAAQGLNTGIHDAVNLAWKLALHVGGVLRPEVLHTYSDERKTVVEQLISYDRDISTLMSHKWPSWYKGDPDADPYVILGEIFEKATSFNTGLGISYPENILNKKNALASVTVAPGSRPHDVLLTVPGVHQALRLQQVAQNNGCFWVIVFAGNVAETRSFLTSLASFLTKEPSLSACPAIRFLTASINYEASPFEALGGMDPFGKMYYDRDASAHKKMGVPENTGGILVLRPDGLLGSAGPLDGAFVKSYFQDIIV